MASTDGTNQSADPGRRRVLTIATAGLGVVGGALAAWPFIGSWQPSARARAAGAPVEVNISKVEPGQLLLVEWRGKPVWILHRTEFMLEVLPTLNDILADPLSKNLSQQPPYAANLVRSIKPEYLVVVGICTHLGCSPEYVPEPGPKPFNATWPGGFFCPCHNSMYDLAGRVFEGVPAPANLPVPPYRYLDDQRILLGEHPPGANV